MRLVLIYCRWGVGPVLVVVVLLLVVRAGRPPDPL